MFGNDGLETRNDIKYGATVSDCPVGLRNKPRPHMLIIKPLFCGPVPVTIDLGRGIIEQSEDTVSNCKIAFRGKVWDESIQIRIISRPNISIHADTSCQTEWSSSCIILK